MNSVLPRTKTLFFTLELNDKIYFFWFSSATAFGIPLYLVTGNAKQVRFP